MSKHLPGPWSWWPECCRVGGMVTMDKPGTHICAPTYFDKDPSITAANARLIAAAPDLLEALKALIDTHDVKANFPEINQARKAVHFAE